MGRLRLETRLEHERVEAAVDIEGRLATLDKYRDLLARFYGFYAAFEPVLHARLPGEFVRRSHLPALRRDAEALEINAQTLLPAQRLPVLRDEAEAIGAMYVIEGSTLGGQIISRMLRERLGLCPDCGGAFFSGYGAQNGPMWRTFCEAVEVWSGTHGNIDGMVVGARETFEAMEAWVVGA